MVKLLKPKVRIQKRVFRRWFRRVGIVFLFSCFLVAVFYIVFKSELFVIKHVNCSVKDKTSLADEKRWCEQAERLLRDQRIISTHLDAVASKLVDQFLPIRDVSIGRKFPQTAAVQISERKPIAKICQLSGREFLVDEEGVVFSEITPETKDLKKVSLELGLELTLGQRLDKDVVSLILLEDPRVRSVKYVDQKGIEVQAEENLTILFSQEKNLEAQIRSLQMIVKKYKIEGKELRRMDLRFDQPVVRYAQ